MQVPKYSDDSFWDKVSKVAQIAKSAIKEVLHKALILYFAAKDENTPAWATTVVFSALAYFIMPIDVIPDYLPVVGYSDDLSVLAGALVTIALHVKKEHRELADQKMDDLFPPKDPPKQLPPGDPLDL